MDSKKISIYKTKIIKEDNDYLLITPYGKLIKINNLGKHILDLSKENNKISYIINTISNEYSISIKQATDDILNFIHNMELCGVIHVYK